MKLNEIASAPGHDFKRQYMLKLMLDNGEQPEIANAAFSRGHFSWSDLEKLGYAKKTRKRIRDGYAEGWTYTGPGAITLITSGPTGEEKQTIQSGQSTQAVEVDYT